MKVISSLKLVLHDMQLCMADKLLGLKTKLNDYFTIKLFPIINDSCETKIIIKPNGLSTLD